MSARRIWAWLAADPRFVAGMARAAEERAAVPFPPYHRRTATEVYDNAERQGASQKEKP